MPRTIIFWVSAAVLCLYVAVAILAPWIAPFDPNAIVGRALQPPDSVHILGTNDIGQDIFSQILYGSRVTLLIGFGAAVIAVTIGTAGGVATGYYGGIFDEIFMRAIDIVMTIPLFPLLLVLTLFFTPGIWGVAVLMGVLGSTTGIRMIRAQTLSVAQASFIDGARAVGAGDLYIMRRHVLPNVLPVVTVKFIGMSQRFLVMGTGLSFLGLGDPSVIDWGQMIEQSYSSGGFALGIWWWLLPPGFAIVGVSVALALIGYSWEDRINPRLEVSRL